MAEFNGPVEAFTALQDFVIDRVAPLPDEISEKLRDCLRERSPVVGVVNALELIYARADDVPPEIKQWAADAAAMSEGHGFHGLDKDSRGSKIAKVMRGQQIAQKDRPEPDVRFAIAAEPEGAAEGGAPVQPAPDATADGSTT